VSDFDFQLGDERLNARASFCVSKIQFNPTLSFPETFSSSKELQGFYRFINNPKAEVKEFKEAVVEQTRMKMATCKKAIAVHDTTTVKPTIKAPRIDEFKHFGGFFAHATLMLDAVELKKVHGVGAVHLYSRAGNREKRGSTGEQYRWFDQADLVENEFEGVDLVHVMDREGDSSPLWSRLIEKNYSFVIRMKSNRKTTTEDGESSRIREEMVSAPIFAQRSIEVSSRKGSACPRSQKSHPPRGARKAIVNISAKSLNVHKTDKHGHTSEETEKLNLVRVFETKTPKSEEPIEWILLTTEPIDNEADVLSVVEIYRARWRIEEFFKGLKSGCQLEERQLTDADSWYRLFILYLPIAVNLLNMRSMTDEKVSPREVTPTQLKILKVYATNVGVKIKTMRDVKMQIARMGGHIAANGNPGWITLFRGYKQLRLLEQGWLLSRNKKM
jgi:hypothetical protein